MNAFVPTARSKVKRLSERGNYDRQAVYAVVDAGLVAHVGYTIDGQPYVTPTVHWRHGDTLFWHGSAASRMLQTVAGCVPACVTVTHIDGVVLARSGFHSSINYRSAMCFGRAEAIRDPKAKEQALEAFVERLTPGRWAELRPVAAQELKGTLVVGMTIEEASVKTRSGGPKDDAEDYAMPIWAGVVPLRLTADAPVPDTKLNPGVMLPDSVAAMVAALKHPPGRSPC
jgi:uncharacterized protein